MMKLPLKGIKILDMTRILAGPLSTQYLGDLGCEVFKIEKPNVGDDTRRWFPPKYNKELSGYFISANRNKKSITIDFKTKKGQELIKELVKNCDIFIENYQYGLLKKYNLDYDSIKEIKKDIIYCSITGYGQNTSKKDLPGYDIISQAESGIMSITGPKDNDEGSKVGVAISDVMTGMNAVSAILASIIYRNNTGEGQYIDLSLFDCSLFYLVNQGMNYLLTSNSPNRMGNGHPNISPYDSFKTKDSSIIIGIGNDEQFFKFCSILNIEINNKNDTNDKRVKIEKELKIEIESKLKQKNRDEWLKLFRLNKITCGPINSIKEGFNENQVKERKMIWNINNIPMIGNPIRFSKTKIEESIHHTSPPYLGQNTFDVLKNELNLNDDQLNQLKIKNII
eukprot:gene11496-4660_t